MCSPPLFCRQEEIQPLTATGQGWKGGSEVAGGTYTPDETSFGVGRTMVRQVVLVPQNWENGLWLVRADRDVLGVMACVNRNRTMVHWGLACNPKEFPCPVGWQSAF